MSHCVQKCVLIFIIFPAGPLGARLNRQCLSRRAPSWISIRNILFILSLGEEWMGWRSVYSGI